MKCIPKPGMYLLARCDRMMKTMMMMVKYFKKSEIMEE